MSPNSEPTQSIFKRLTTLVLIGVLSIISLSVSANSLNHYLPLKTDALFELEIDKLATVAQMPLLAKPYHLATVQIYLDKIREEFPELYHRISSYLTRYKPTQNITHLSAELSYSDFEGKNLANQRGRTTESNLMGEVSGYWQLADNWNLALGATIYDGSEGIIPNNTYLSYINEYFQIDLGYKEMWMSPLQESAMLLSTNAKPIARFAISSPTPWTDYQLRYDISFGKLEEMQGIEFDGETSSGKPGFLTMHLSTQPVDWWTLGFNRTMVFGGGKRKVGLGQLWEAFIDPVSGDNCGGQSDLQDCSKEVGNQQASISSKFDFNFGMPLTLNLELAGEDTNDFKFYLLGNKAYSVGVFAPYLTQKSSLLFEYQYIENAWYTHHIYQEGYRNDLHSMGHWWGDEKLLNDGIGASIFTTRFNYEWSDEYYWNLKFTTVDNENLGDEGSSNESIYQRSYEWTLSLDQIKQSSIFNYQLYFGNDNFGNDFTRFSIKYSWQ